MVRKSLSLLYNCKNLFRIKQILIKSYSLYSSENQPAKMQNENFGDTKENNMNVCDKQKFIKS